MLVTLRVDTRKDSIFVFDLEQNLTSGFREFAKEFYRTHPLQNYRLSSSGANRSHNKELKSSGTIPQQQQPKQQQEQQRQPKQQPKQQPPQQQPQPQQEQRQPSQQQLQREQQLLKLIQQQSQPTSSTKAAKPEPQAGLWTPPVEQPQPHRQQTTNRANRPSNLLRTQISAENDRMKAYKPKKYQTPRMSGVQNRQQMSQSYPQSTGEQAKKRTNAPNRKAPTNRSANRTRQYQPKQPAFDPASFFLNEMNKAKEANKKQ